MDPPRLREPSNPLDLEFLRKERELFISKSRADSTWKQYNYAFDRFKRWTAAMGAQALPCSEEVAQLYITYVAHAKSSVSAAISAYAAINAVHETKGFPSPVKTPSTKLILEGIKRTFGKPSKQSAFLSPEQTGAFVAVCLAAAPVRRALPFMRAGWCEAACFRGAARFGDLVRVVRKDVSVFKDKVIISFLERKNDKRHDGHDVIIPATGSPPFHPIELC